MDPDIKSFENGASWYHIAAENGHDEARFRLGVMYLLGMGVEKSFDTGVELLASAIVSGNQNANALYKALKDDPEYVDKDFNPDIPGFETWHKLTHSEPDFVPPSRKAPYFDLRNGWMFDGRRITAEEAESLCSEMKIPFRKPDDSSPNSRIFLMEFQIAGTQFTFNPSKTIDGIKEGDRLRFEREPYNRFDNNAIMVTTDSGIKLGYIPRKMNLVPANIMDVGGTLTGEIIGIDEGKEQIYAFLFLEEEQKAVRRHISPSPMVNHELILDVDVYPADRNSWLFKEIGDYDSVEFERQFTSENMWDLLWGHTSKIPGDRWNCFFEDDILYISYRESGQCYYELVLGEGVNTLRISKTDEFIDTRSESEHIDLVNDLLDYWLNPMPIPVNVMPKNILCSVDLYSPAKGWYVEQLDDGIIRIHYNKPYHS